MEVVRKPVPVIVSVWDVAPTAREAGLSCVIVGIGLAVGVTVKVAVAEPPPGAGLVTTTGKAPAVPRSASVRPIVSRFVLLNVAA